MCQSRAGVFCYCNEQLPTEEEADMWTVNTFDEKWALSELSLTSLCMVIPVVQAAHTIPVGP